MSFKPSPELQAPIASQDPSCVMNPQVAVASVTVDSVTRPILKHECRVLDYFDDQVYPEGLPRPTSVPHITYPRDFLLAFKTFNIAPDGLPPIDYFAEPEPVRRNPARQASGPGVGCPPHRQQSYNESKGTMPTMTGPGSSSCKENTSQFGNPHRIDSRDGDKEERGGKYRNYSMKSQHSVNEPYVESIKASNTGWMPTVINKEKPVYESEEAAIEALENEVVKKATGLLNKLTIERFDSISGHFLELPITNQPILEKVLALIFDKALDERFFQNMYGRLCQRLCCELPKVQTWIDANPKKNLFRRLLLNKCQEEFESSKKWTMEMKSSEESQQERFKRLNNMTLEEKEKYAQEEYERIKLKRRVLGNVTFIGELFLLEVANEKTMHRILEQLLQEVTNPEEEEVESICKLLAITGGCLDHEKVRARMDVYFARIKVLSINMNASSRIRFMLQDLLELRRNKWKARQEATGPMTIAEIHASVEKTTKQLEAGRASRTNHSAIGRDDCWDRDRNDRRGSRNNRDCGGHQDHQGSGCNGSQDMRQQHEPSADGWNIVQKSRRREDNFRNFGKTKSKNEIMHMQLAPQGSTWDKAGNANGHSVATKEDAKNSFSCLSHGDNHKEPSKDSSPLSVAPAVAESDPAVPMPSQEKATKKIEGTVEEWFSLFDVTEVIACHKELYSYNYNQQLLSFFINTSLSKDPESLSKTAKLVTALLEAGCVSIDDVEKSLVEVAANLEDLSYDIPGVHKCFDTYYSWLLIKDENALSLKCLADYSGPLAEVPIQMLSIPEVLAATFDSICEFEGENSSFRKFCAACL
ncbi:armadillo-type protein [Chytriomyces sp. MP71]|nr:armadillo-type protein [Chytriomyces sp. MP71]